jgi:hypothetical protein
MTETRRLLLAALALCLLAPLTAAAERLAPNAEVLAKR